MYQHEKSLGNPARIGLIVAFAVSSTAIIVLIPYLVSGRCPIEPWIACVLLGVSTATGAGLLMNIQRSSQ